MSVCQFKSYSAEVMKQVLTASPESPAGPVGPGSPTSPYWISKNIPDLKFQQVKKVFI